MQFSFLLDDLGIPKNYRHMEGFGVHTYTLINREGKVTYVKYHWKPTCGTSSIYPQWLRQGLHCMIQVFTPLVCLCCMTHISEPQLSPCEWCKRNLNGAGVECLLEDEAITVGGSNHSHATQDLYDSIAKGDFPEWGLYVQVGMLPAACPGLLQP